MLKLPVTKTNITSPRLLVLIKRCLRQPLYEYSSKALILYLVAILNTESISSLALLSTIIHSLIGTIIWVELT